MGLPIVLGFLTASVLVATGPAERPAERPVAVVERPGLVLSSTSSSRSLMARETAGPDTFALYGGPDELYEGKFIRQGNHPDWGGGNGLPGGGYGGGPDAWTPKDMTKLPVYWHVSTFNAANLHTNGPGNRAMWCGLEDTDPATETWISAPGYGNGWGDELLYVSAPVNNPAVGETVSLNFFMNYDTEPDYDLVRVEYDRAGQWVEVARADGTNATGPGSFAAPGVQFTSIQTQPITYQGNDFGGIFGDEIRIRIRFSSDGGWSDQDGFFMSSAGAVQVDDITVQSSVGTAVETFEGAGPWFWNPVQVSFVGDFADVYSSMSDTDPCRDNISPVIGFIDFGQAVRNGPSPTGVADTGGSTSPGNDYGIAGSFVVNYNGGLTFGEKSLFGEVWSPVIDWDAPGTLDNGNDVAGAFLRFSIWADLPFANGIFYNWRVRSATVGQHFGSWEDQEFVRGAAAPPSWDNLQFDVTGLLVTPPERVQIALACMDFADLFSLPGIASTPSPVFDNVSFYKYRVGGPSISARSIDLAQDGFPVSGVTDPSTPSNRDAMDIPFNMARDVNQFALVIDPGDSIIADVAAVIPGSAVTDIRMVWALSPNPLFEPAIRSAPAGPVDENVITGPGSWSGEVVASQSTAASGAIVPGRWFFDLPDQDFIYPGDVLHYYIQATDDAGRMTTLPSDISGFGTFGPTSGYDRSFVVRGLPSFRDTAGTQPEILVINNYGHRGIDDEILTSFDALGFAEGLDFDSYTVAATEANVSNGIGAASAHGAEANQLAGYNSIFIFNGNLASGLLSNGTNTGNNDKGNDIESLELWQALFPAPGGSRNVAYFGDNLATAMRNDSVDSYNYLAQTMGVDWVASQVSDVIGNQIAPRIVPNPTAVNGLIFHAEYIAQAECAAVASYDHIRALSPGESGHFFTSPNGVPITGLDAPAASVLNQRTHGVHITFPYTFSVIRDPASRTVGMVARTKLLQEILLLFNAGTGPNPVAAPAARRAALSVAPNPFNPATQIEFTAQAGSRGSIKVFSLRGELVRTLHEGEFQQTLFVWDGTDLRGAPVASGVYLVQATDGSVTSTQKVALVK